MIESPKKLSEKKEFIGSSTGNSGKGPIFKTLLYPGLQILPSGTFLNLFLCSVFVYVCKFHFLVGPFYEMAEVVTSSLA